MIGQTVSHYRILEKIGQGGMGEVYLAEDTKLKRQVALKFLPPQLTKDPEAKKRFEREAQAAATLNHPNIVTIHEIGEYEGQVFIAMEHVEGQTLKELISVHRTPSAVDRSPMAPSPLPIAEAIAIASQIASGLSAAHAKGIVHRDIKPQNILIDKNNRVKILDFGLAKLKGVTPLTKEASTLGTVHYMSPEQALGKDVDHRTDIWSLGVVLYEMLTGQLPFKGDYEQAVIYSILNDKPEPLMEPPGNIAALVYKALQKDPEKRYLHISEMGDDLKTLGGGHSGGFFKFFQTLKKPQLAVPAIALLVLLCFFAIRALEHESKIRWARNELLPEINQQIAAGYESYAGAYLLAKKAERYIPNDPDLAAIFSTISVISSIRTEPEGAKVFIKNYQTPESEWEYAGISPIAGIRLPIAYVRLKIEKEGFETVWAASTTFGFDFSKKDMFVPYQIVRRLEKKGSIPEGMTRIPGTTIKRIGKIDDFFIDRYEVTNRQYKEFVNQGGYRDKRYWKQRFIKDGKELSWEEAQRGFVDRTDRPGPSGWLAGDYPDGQGDYPVSGISWYEAAAYAEFAGKSLPTVYHWGIARGEYTLLLHSKFFSQYFTPQSNFSDQGPAPAGSHPAITSYGVYDMGGNVREWCWNETPAGRAIRGGAWNDAPYMFSSWSQLSPFDRSPKNGFRCAQYPDPSKILAAESEKVNIEEIPNFYKQHPVPEQVFNIYKEQFAYDKGDLDSRVEKRNETAKDWVEEKISFAATYENERIIAYLFLPRNGSPPYQTIIYFPGSTSISMQSSDDLANYREFSLYLSPLVKNGRAVLYPVFKGTFERGIDPWPESNTHQETELIIKEIEDFKRCIDYLETRPEIDCRKLAYLGVSWGGNLGAIIPAVEERLQASVLISGGMHGDARPEVNEINYVTRVKIPTLMLNGKYDMTFPYETSIKPMFDLLGTPKKQKELKLYGTDHIVPRNEAIKETLNWLDRFLGPVK